jgi:hypothetical protein
VVFEGRPQYQSIFGASETSWNQLKGNLGGSGTDSLAVGFDTTINGKLYKNVKYFDITAYPAQPLNYDGRVYKGRYPHRQSLVFYFDGYR